MKLLLFAILFISHCCLSQSTQVKKNFYALYSIDSLIRGDWNLVESYVNDTKVKRKVGKIRLSITADSLIQITDEKQLPGGQWKEFTYEVHPDPGSDMFKLDILRKKRKKYLFYHQFNCWFRNFNELVVSYETTLEDGLANVPIKTIYVFKRFETNLSSDHPLDQNWFYCKKENEGFAQRMQSDQRFTFYRDTTNPKSCSGRESCLNFTRSIYQISWALEKEEKPFHSFFGSDAEIFLSEKWKKIYLFNGSMVLVYTIEELDTDKMILKQDNEATKQLNR